MLRCFIFLAASCTYQRLQNQLFVLISERRRLKMKARRYRMRKRQSPYMWVLPKPVESWFEINYHNRTLPDTVFRKKMRMDRETFDRLLNVLGPSITRQDTMMRDCIPPEKVLAIALYRLAHGNSYESMAPALNVGKTTAIEAVQDVVNRLYELRGRYIKFPATAAEIAASIETFADLSDLPNVVGAIDGTHIVINAPRNSAVDYFSRYQSHDFIIQGIVDGRKLFLHAAAGYPGAMHDARVLRSTAFYRQAERGEKMKGPTVHIENQEIGPYLVGDSAYPLSQWLQKPYPEGTRDPEEKAYNKALSSARVVIECAFGILKSRWRILDKRLDSHIKFSVRIAVACIVLHNFCIGAGDNWDDAGIPPDDIPNERNDETVGNGEDIREILKRFIARAAL